LFYVLAVACAVAGFAELTDDPARAAWRSGFFVFLLAHVVSVIRGGHKPPAPSAESTRRNGEG
jgi:hypothetical protein